jgi:hypothetical protein
MKKDEWVDNRTKMSIERIVMSFRLWEDVWYRMILYIRRRQRDIPCQVVHKDQHAHMRKRRKSLCLLEKITPSTIQQTVNIYSCQRHCFAISSSSIWVACCLDRSSRLVLLASKPRRALSSSGLALWKSPLRAIFAGPWGRVCWNSRLSMTTWGLDLQYSVQMRSLSCTSIACEGLENQFTAQLQVYGSNKLT